MEYIELPTPQEIKVISLICEGCCNKEIAQRLSISLHTVDYHLRNIYQKLGASGRGDASVKAIKAGWIGLKEVTN